eukprot:scaffold127678_cov69-Phaeocystis_antarctica.AAC.3
MYTPQAALAVLKRHGLWPQQLGRASPPKKVEHEAAVDRQEEQRAPDEALVGGWLLPLHVAWSRETCSPPPSATPPKSPPPGPRRTASGARDLRAADAPRTSPGTSPRQPRAPAPGSGPGGSRWPASCRWPSGLLARRSSARRARYKRRRRAYLLEGSRQIGAGGADAPVR